MKKSQIAMLAFLKSGIWGRTEGHIEEADIDEIMEEAKCHVVMPLVFSGLYNEMQKNSALAFDENKVAKYKAYTFAYINRYYFILKKQVELTELLDNHNISYCILKGTSVAQFYKNPQYRVMGDIDVYVEPENFDRVCELIKETGYSYDKTTTQYHSAFYKDGIEIELHNSFAGLPVGKTRTKLYFLKDICKRRENKTINNIGFYAPSIMDNGIVQLLHLIHHVSEGQIGIRHICDWMLYVDSCITDEVWYSQIQKVYKDAKLEHFAKLLTRICQRYLGLGEEKISWCKDISDEECEKFMNYVMKKSEEKKEEEEEYVEASGKKLENLWDYQRETHVSYDVQLFFRTLKKLLKGEKNLKKIKYRYLKIKKLRRRFADLGVFCYRDTKDYSMV